MNFYAVTGLGCFGAAAAGDAAFVPGRNEDAAESRRRHD